MSIPRHASKIASVDWLLQRSLTACSKSVPWYGVLVRIPTVRTFRLRLTCYSGLRFDIVPLLKLISRLNCMLEVALKWSYKALRTRRNCQSLFPRYSIIILCINSVRGYFFVSI